MKLTKRIQSIELERDWSRYGEAADDWSPPARRMADDGCQRGDEATTAWTGITDRSIAEPGEPVESLHRKTAVMQAW